MKGGGVSVLRLKVATRRQKSSADWSKRVEPFHQERLQHTSWLHNGQSESENSLKAFLKTKDTPSWNKYKYVLGLGMRSILKSKVKHFHVRSRSVKRECHSLLIWISRIKAIWQGLLLNLRSKTYETDVVRFPSQWLLWVDSFYWIKNILCVQCSPIPGQMTNESVLFSETKHLWINQKSYWFI